LSIPENAQLENRPAPGKGAVFGKAKDSGPRLLGPLGRRTAARSASSVYAQAFDLSPIARPANPFCSYFSV